MVAIHLLLGAAVWFGSPGSQPTRPPAQARQVTIYRDTYGVPHVAGKTDAATAFGFGFAQAEDNFLRLEDNYIRSIGRLAEIEGEAGVGSDQFNRLLEIPRLARAEYRRLEPRIKGLVDGFAAGVNYYLSTHPAVRPRLLTRIEPWYPLAFIRYNYYQNGFARSAGIRRSEFTIAQVDEMIPPGNTGSNGWVVNPSRTVAGHALLFINPHLPFFGPGQVYEGHLLSEEGWNFTGYARFGFPLPYVGHNESVGWVSTDNNADLADAYLETFDDPARPLAYRYGTSHRVATEWTDSIRVRVGETSTTRVFTFRKTHHGPIVGRRGDRWLALRLSKIDADGWLGEWYRMTRAKNLVQFKAAMRPLAVQFGNAMYADRDGNTFYVYNGAIPKRDPQFDWSNPVDGADPRTEWQGWHGFDELPQLTNPTSGWMQNCNGTPFLLTDRDNPQRSAFPSYLATEPDTRRAAISRRILSTTPRWTFEAWTAAAFDTYVVATDSLLPILFGEFERIGADAPLRRRLEPAVDTLRRWNRKATIASVATTLFDEWRASVENPDGWPPLAALDSAVARLTRRHGDWRTTWGTVNRLQRAVDPGAGRADTSRSLPLAAVNGNDGAVFTMYTGDSERPNRTGVAGATYVSVVEFGPRVRALSVHVFGASGNPSSPHFFDQAELYAAGRFKPSWFTLAEIREHLEASYHPGQR